MPNQKNRHLNWTLIIGSVLVGLMILLAIFGPLLAPQDPMQENYTLRVNDRIQSPPYPAFKVDGYPLGTDRFGRDLLSRILWGVRPTLIMVATVAAFRLIVGMILGLIIGWAEGRSAHRLDSILSSLLSIPVLIVALIGIYAIGTDKGLWAFIFGLGITGWAETARIVSEQTRIIKKQTFVEAAHALGAGKRLILFQHILPQITSLVWMLLAFEVSSTLLIAAELGFLGIFIGGGIWIEVSDFQAVNVAGLPELGQILSTALVRASEPSALLITGFVILIGLLGFNLLGEGLRIEFGKREFGGTVGLLPRPVVEWVDERIFVPFRYWLELNSRKVSIAITIFFIVVGALLYYQRNQFLFDSSPITLTIAGEHLWATELRDAYGTLYTPYNINTQPELKWQTEIAGGASGGVAIYANGTIIIAGKENILLAISPQGEVLWETALLAKPVGTPALGEQGQIYIADVEGFVSAFDKQGNLLWRVEASSTREATSGPIVASNGMIYVTMIDAVVGVSSDGVLVWRKTAATVYVDSPPRLSADERLVYLKDTALDAMTGVIQEIPIRSKAEVLFTEPAFFTGSDGRNYYRNGHQVIRWYQNDSGLQTETPRTWKYESFVLFNPLNQGVTPNQLAWLFYGTDYSNARMVWLDKSGRLVGNFEFPFTNSRLIAMGENGEAYLCGPTGARIKCVLAIPGVEKAQWEVFIENASRPIGGALVNGTLYVVSADGMLFALSPSQP